MSHIRTFLITVLVVLFAGCPARSLQPLFFENDKTDNPLLIGTWSTGDETYTFSRSSDNTYRAVIRSLTSEDSAQYAVRAGKIGPHWFIDTYPFNSSDEHHFLSVHVFTKMEIVGDTLFLASLESDWLKNQIDEKKIAVTHIKRGSEIILSGSTAELQALFLKIGSEPDAFPHRSHHVKVR
jgi:hypothetical protein